MTKKSETLTGPGLSKRRLWTIPPRPPTPTHSSVWLKISGRMFAGTRPKQIFISRSERNTHDLLPSHCAKLAGTQYPDGYQLADSCKEMGKLELGRVIIESTSAVKQLASSTNNKCCAGLSLSHSLNNKSGSRNVVPGIKLFKNVGLRVTWPVRALTVLISARVVTEIKHQRVFERKSVSLVERTFLKLFV